MLIIPEKKNFQRISGDESFPSLILGKIFKILPVISLVFRIGNKPL
jgi:hypothetical protein